MPLPFEIPDHVKHLIQKLRRAGYTAYAVGGCVRDSLLGSVPNDWDICTSSTPQETLSALQAVNIIENGMKHGTVTVRYQGENFEITTFRIDGAYEDHRRPESVTFVTDVREDLSRRDFTINAMACDENEGIIDFFGGRKDLDDHIIRCVGDPDKRFQEDGLRIMRALRFAARFEFEIEPKTAEAIHRNKDLLKSISAERINAEFTQLLMSKGVEKLLLDYRDVLEVFVPEIAPMVGFQQRNPHHVYDVWEHTVKVVSFAKQDKVLRLAAFFHDIGKPNVFTLSEDGTGHFHGHPELSEKMAKTIMNRLKYDNNTIAKVGALIRLHDKRPPLHAPSVRRLLRDIGEELYPALMDLKRADAMGQNPKQLSEKLLYVDKLREMIETEIRSRSPYTLKMLALNGRDLMQIGFCSGREIGETLNALLSLVIDEQLPNEKQALLKEAEKRLMKTNVCKQVT